MAKIYGVKYPAWWDKKVWYEFAPGVNQYKKVRSGPLSEWTKRARHITAKGHPKDFLDLKEVSGWRYAPTDTATWSDGITRAGKKKCSHLILYRVRLKQWEPDKRIDRKDKGGPVSPDKKNYGYCQGCKAYFVVDSAVKEYPPRRGEPDSDRDRTEAAPQYITLAAFEPDPVPRKRKCKYRTEVGMARDVDSGIVHNRIADLLWHGEDAPILTETERWPEPAEDRDSIVITHRWAEVIAAIVGKDGAKCSPRQVEQIGHTLFGELPHLITSKETADIKRSLRAWLRLHEVATDESGQGAAQATEAPKNRSGATRYSEYTPTPQTAPWVRPREKVSKGVCPAERT